MSSQEHKLYQRTCEKLVDRLNCAEESVRAAALRELGELSPAAFPDLLDAERARRAGIGKHALAPCLVAGIVCFLVGGFLSLSALAYNSLVSVVLLLAGGCVGMAACVWLGLTLCLRAHVHKQTHSQSVLQSILTAIADCEDPHFVVPAMMWIERNRNNSAIDPYYEQQIASLRTALARLLPQLEKVERYHVTQAYEESWLYLLQDATANRELTVQVLYQLGQHGRSSRYRLVEGLASYEKDSKIREAATQCLHELERRQAEARETQTLLRPSMTSPGMTSEGLLRPAEPRPDSIAPEQLLRPSSSNSR